MRRLAIVVLAVVAVCLPASAGAITYGQPDGTQHPMVGALIGTFDDGTYPYCSGSLVSPTTLVTAAHCEEGNTVCVTFDERYTSHSKLVCGAWHASTVDDIAVVVFSKAVQGITPAVLPALGLLDSLKAQGALAGATFTTVGYGAFAPTRGPGGYSYTYPDARYSVVGTFSSLQRSYLQVSQNPVLGDGGSCFGDSGGPIFRGSSTTAVALVTTGDVVCRATNVGLRLDTPSVRDFLAPYLSS